MKLAIRIMCAVTVALLALGLALHLSATGLAGADALARDTLASGVVNLGGKLAIIAMFVAAYIAGQQAQWRWVAALVILAIVTLFAGPLGALTNSGALFYFLAPFAGAAVGAAYTLRMGELTPARAWWRKG